MENLGKKQFTFKGKTIEDLQKLDVREFAQFLTSNQRRSLLRNFQEVEIFVNRSKVKLNKNKLIKTHNRSLVIVPAMVEMKIAIYNGHAFVPVEITGEMLGHKLGEYSLTRARVRHVKSGTGGTKGSSVQARK